MYLLGKETSNQAKQSVYICSKVEMEKCPKVVLSDKPSELVSLVHLLMYPCSPQPFPSMQFSCYLLELSLKTNIINSCQLVSVSDYWRWNLIHQSEGNRLVTLVKSAHKLEQDMKIQPLWSCSNNWGQIIIEFKAGIMTRNTCACVHKCVIFLRKRLQAVQETVIKVLFYLFWCSVMQL